MEWILERSCEEGRKRIARRYSRLTRENRAVERDSESHKRLMGELASKAWGDKASNLWQSGRRTEGKRTSLSALCQQRILASARCCSRPIDFALPCHSPLSASRRAGSPLCLPSLHDHSARLGEDHRAALSRLVRASALV